MGLTLMPMSGTFAQDADPSDFNEPEAFTDLDLEQLSRVRIVSATLTPTQVRLVPAKTTVLDAATIESSGARNLNELLEVYTPNTQLIQHNTHQPHFGIRGIISDRDDKYLLRVNGKVMNNRFLVGSESERGIPLLGDLKSVSLIHGPGSATYGAGALAGVLNLETYNGLTFEGTDVRIRQGFWNQMTTAEFRFGHKFGDDSGLFLYAGVGDQRGADQDDSPYVFGKSFATPGSTPDVVSGEPVAFSVPNQDDGGDILKMKFHASYVTGPLELWMRYTQDGTVTRLQRSVLMDAALKLTEEDFLLVAQRGRKSQNQQFTAAAKYKEDLSDVFNLETFVSYQWYLYKLWIYDQYPDPDDRIEEEVYGRVLGTWTPNQTHSVGVGLEFSHMWFDGGPVGYGPAPGVAPVSDTWQTDTVSLLAEHQWHFAENWTSFASARGDKHSYTEWLFSPRLALAYTPTPKDTFKLIGARAVRRNGDGELRQEHVQTNEQGTTETLESLEFRYERQHDDHWHFGCSVFVEQNEAIGFSAAENHSVGVGTFAIWGLEPELSYRTKNTKLALSHGYTQLFDSSLATPDTVQGISAEPYGYGHDLANWANHITKFSVNHDWNEQWSSNTSLRVYWGFPGAQDLVEWNGDRGAPLSFGLADPGYDDSFGPSVFWNAGLEYRPTQRMTLRLDAYNILGWFDEKLNKRLHYFRGSNYSSEAPAVVLTAKVSF